MLGILGRKKANETESGGRMAVAGLVTGGIGLVIGLIVGAVFLVGLFTDDYNTGDYNTDPSNGVCDYVRYLQDPDC